MKSFLNFQIQLLKLNSFGKVQQKSNYLQFLDLFKKSRKLKKSGVKHLKRNCLILIFYTEIELFNTFLIGAIFLFIRTFPVPIVAMIVHIPEKLLFFFGGHIFNFVPEFCIQMV